VSTAHHRLARISPPAAFLLALVVVLVGLFAPGIVGGAVLLSVVLGLGYLSRLTWSVQPPATRVARLVILASLAVIAVVKIV